MKSSTRSIKSVSDNALLGLVVNKDQSAFAELVDRHIKPVFRLSYSIQKDVMRAEDVTQEVFMTLWEKADTWQPTGQLRSWLFRIARNKSIDEIRRRKEHIDIDKMVLEDKEQSPYGETFRSEVNEILDKHMADLPERQRDAIMLVHFLECTNIEAAETMDISVDAMESLLARGRKKLKALLTSYDEVLFEGR